MASVEYIKERIKNAEDFIEKKTTTIEKKEKTIEKKLSKLPTDKFDRDWTLSEVECLKEDIERAKRDIEDKKASLKEYMVHLDELMNIKRDCKPLVEFLDGWKERASAWYLAQKDSKERLNALNAWHYTDNERCEYFNRGRWVDINENGLTREETRLKLKELDDEADRLKSAYLKEWGTVHDLLYREKLGKGKTYEEMVEDMLKAEWERKYDDLIARVTKYVGVFTSTDHLYVGDNGSINGYVEGEKGRARVETIWAGGYNIQCLHYRVLIHMVK